MGFQVDRMVADRTRANLAENELARQEAVCMFPIVVMTMASGMRKMLELHKLAPSENTAETLAYMEECICDEFRKTFGHDMVQRNDDD